MCMKINNKQTYLFPHKKKKMFIPKEIVKSLGREKSVSLLRSLGKIFCSFFFGLGSTFQSLGLP